MRRELARAAIAELARRLPNAAAAHVIELYRARLAPEVADDEREPRIAAIDAERARLRELGLDEATFAHHLHELDLIEDALDR